MISYVRAVCKGIYLYEDLKDGGRAIVEQYHLLLFLSVNIFIHIYLYLYVLISIYIDRIKFY